MVYGFRGCGLQAAHEPLRLNFWFSFKVGLDILNCFATSVAGLFKMDFQFLFNN